MRGHAVPPKAATLIYELHSDPLTAATDQVPAILGALLVTIERLDRAPSGQIALPDQPPAQLRMLEAASRRFTISATLHRLTEGLTNLAIGDAIGCIAAIDEVLRSRRASEGDGELAWRVLPALGEIGGTHGVQPGVLRRVLPILYTYVVHGDASLRAAAIDAWTKIARRNPTPSSLSDLLPGLLADRYVVVIRSLLNTAATLPWTSEDRTLLLRYAWVVTSNAPATDTDTLKAALAARGETEFHRRGHARERRGGLTSA